MANVERPGPLGKDDHGITTYDGRAVQVYRLLNGVKRDDLAEQIFFRASSIAHYESGVPILQAQEAAMFMDGIDELVASREKLVSEGARLKALLDAETEPHSPEETRVNRRQVFARAEQRQKAAAR